MRERQQAAPEATLRRDNGVLVVDPGDETQGASRDAPCTERNSSINCEDSAVRAPLN